MRYVLGLLFIATGICSIVFTEWIVRTFGRVAWAEEKLGAEGGTRIFYKLVGLGLMMLGVLFMTGKIFNIFDTIFVHSPAQQSV